MQQRANNPTTTPLLLSFAGHDATSTDPHLVAEAFGIEAGRSALREQLCELFAASAPDPRHIELLADLLSIDGLIGIRRNDVTDQRTALELASFEELRKALTTSGLQHKHEQESAVHGADILNHPSSLGTGAIVLQDCGRLDDPKRHKGGEEVVAAVQATCTGQAVVAAAAPCASQLLDELFGWCQPDIAHTP